MESIKEVIFDVIPSTQTHAKQQFETLYNTGEWFAIRTRKQTVGVGQYDRKWDSGDESRNTLVTFIIPDFKNLAFLHTVPLIVSYAIIQTVREYVDCRIKWRNDLFINGLKAGGVLCESEMMDKLTLFVGIGVNINYSPQNATNLEREYGQHVDEEVFFQKLKKNVYENIQNLNNQGFQPYKQPLEDLLLRKGELCQFVHAQTDQLLHTGIFERLNDQGLIVLRLENGTLIVIQDDVRLKL